MRKNFYLGFAIFAFLFFSCATKSAMELESDFFDADGFYETQLENGIEFSFRKMATSEICTIRIYFVGGCPFYSQEFSGIESISCAMMTRGGKKYSFEKIRKILYEESASFFSSSGKDFSFVGVRGVKSSFLQMFDILCDGVLNPSMDALEFVRLMNDEESDLQFRLSNPADVLIFDVENVAFKNHPYSTKAKITSESFKNISLELVSDYAKNLLNPARIFICCAGNFSESEIKFLEKKLNKTFGKLKNPANEISTENPATENLKNLVAENPKNSANENSAENPTGVSTLAKNPATENLKNLVAENQKKSTTPIQDPKKSTSENLKNPKSQNQNSATENLDQTRKNFFSPKIPEPQIELAVVRSECENAGSSPRIAGFFNAPARTSNEYIPFAISTMILDDILFQKVREEMGAVYSIGMGVISGRVSIGVLSVSRAKEKVLLKKYIQEAILAFPEKDEIETRLEEYKNKYFTALYENSQTSQALCANIAASKIYFNDTHNFLERSSRVQEASAEQVLQAYKKYIANFSDWSWAIVAAKETLDEVKF